MPLYPEYAKELQSLVEQDQQQWKAFWRQHYQKQDSYGFKTAFKKVRLQQHAHTKRMTAILDKIQEPSITNIGKEAAQAISIIALHDSLPILKRVLKAFEVGYLRAKKDTYYQAIPSMTDQVLLLERNPQRFGTQWEGNGLSEPFLPTVADFEHVNERRAVYGIEPLRWPKSLAIPEVEQPWLQKPITDLIMRDLSEEEFIRSYAEYLI